MLNVPIAAWPAAEPLVLELKSLELGAGQMVAPLTNRQKVRALIRRCELAGQEVRVRDVIAVADVDESLFFRWQRGGSVSHNICERCNAVTAMGAGAFLKCR